MQKINRKKLAKAALLTASLTMGTMIEQPIFGQAQQTGNTKTKLWVYITPPPGVNTSSRSCGTLSGTEC